MSWKGTQSLSTTPFPNLLLDQLMPSLKDTEWRLLCVIVRQTFGWRDGKTGARKTSDWLTQRQLVQRTGRSSEAISRAIDALVRQRLLEVRGSSGGVLETAAQRRQARGRIDYRLHPRLLSLPPAKERPHKSEFLAPALPSPNSLLRSQSRKSEYPTAAKANGTKENTKETLTKGLAMLSTFVQQYQSEYRARSHGPLPEPSKMSLDSLAQLLAHHSIADLNALRDAFFACEVQAIVRNGYGLESFVDAIHLLAFAPRKTR